MRKNNKKSFLAGAVLASVLAGGMVVPSSAFAVEQEVQPVNADGLMAKILENYEGLKI